MANTDAAIDALLERYLHLLHEYTALREQLNALQAGMYRDIARANFAAERGMRYGPDHYDERMRASRRVAITTATAAAADDDANAPTTSFETITWEEEEEPDAPPPTPPPASSAGLPPETIAGASSSDGGASSASGVKDDGAGAAEDAAKSHHLEKKKEMRRRDPVRWFGLLTPMALRQAQAQSIRAVEQVIPRLVSVNAEMARVEIEVRRARKKRAKAEIAASRKEHEESLRSEEITA
ncbi:hypothetical protein DL764_007351 [Monosporascus ibericus]|uniref:Vacuolar ATPase assembly protein VMA22 n=1 Tax=Monosporascus ibericus TaxID=155417 RepID=A0A4Q4T4L8_9PEZI|nr:hypothetical protein DL764_007351 [Monosporascus ibericus]